MHHIKTITCKSILKLLLVLTCVVLIASCKKHDDYDFTATVTANVRLVNTSTDGGPAKLYMTDVLRTPNAVSFGTASAYNLTYTGQVDVSVQSASNTVLATTNTAIDAQGNYTFFLTGTTGSYGVITLNDNTTAAASGKAKVRFVQASSSVTSGNLLGNGTALFSAQAFKAVSDYSEVSAGTYVFTVTNTGSAAVLATSASATLQAGKNYTVYTSGISGTTGTTALAVNVLANN
ncbi:MAG: DUF4397 domain-containing protein [Bacteroidota bacterium]